MASFVCYRFQCPRYSDCALAAGKGCCIERDPDQQEVPVSYTHLTLPTTPYV